MAQSNQSKATRKYEASHGWMSKTYKMKRDIVVQFAEACKKSDVNKLKRTYFTKKVLNN